jgi:hypothetical protein
MNRLEVSLNNRQELYLFNFFLFNSRILQIEHYAHTHSPLDNLKHYMWEELHEPDHKSLLQTYEESGYLTDDNLLTWVKQELQEKDGLGGGTFISPNSIIRT